MFNPVGFMHRELPNASIESICLRCYRTVGQTEQEIGLETPELKHRCDPFDLEHLKEFKSKV
jgi:hypothetical protein